MESLLSKGADLYAVDICGWNILHYASFHAKKDTIRFICKYDADYDILKNTKNTQNKLPIEILSDYNLKPYFISLWHAAREGDLDMTRRLIDIDNQNVNEPTYFEQNTPLHLAVLNNHFLEVRLLIEDYKANATLKNKYGIEPYNYAYITSKHIKTKLKKCNDIERDIFDLRETFEFEDTKKSFKDLIKKPDDIINSIINSIVKYTVCEKNYKLRIWTANDFNEKIINELKQK